jgi:hypothetical protein
LRVTKGKPNNIHFQGRTFEIVCTAKDNAAQLMKAWYKERANTKFSEIAEPIIHTKAFFALLTNEMPD